MKVTRRGFMGGAAAAAMGLPFLGNFAHARDGGAPKRVVLLWTPNDPQWTEEYESPLADDGALPEVFPSFLAGLESHRDHLAVLSGIQGLGGHHTIAEVLTGVPFIGPDANNMWGGGISIDQHIAAARGETGLAVGVSCGSKNGKGRMIYSGPEAPVDPAENPVTLFEELFADLDLDTTELEHKRARQQSVLDRVAADLGRYQAQLPSHQRERMEQHLDGIRAIEASLDETLLGSCEPTPIAIDDPGANDVVPEVLRAQMSVVAQALGCGATSVATIQFTRAGGGTVTPMWPGDGIELSSNPHTLAHDHYQNLGDTAFVDPFLALERWYAAQFGYLLDQLAAIPDVDGNTVLDNTLVVHIKECGRQHAGSPAVYTLAGGASLLTGNRSRAYPGATHADVLATILDRAGVSHEGFGSPTAPGTALEV